MLQLAIPVLDMAGLRRGGASRRDFIEQASFGFHKLGFIGLRNHGVSPAVRRAFFGQLALACELSADTKRRYVVQLPGQDRPDYQRGYAPLSSETAKDGKHADPKEYWHIGRELAANDPLRQHPRFSNLRYNVWPDEVPDFKSAAVAFYDAHYAVACEIAGVYDEILGFDRVTIAAKMEGGDTIIRGLHYPPIRSGEKGMRAAAHGDINVATLLDAGTRGGLQVLPALYRGEYDAIMRHNEEIEDEDSKQLVPESWWIDAPAFEGVLLCNSGDMMEIISRGALPSTIHRVINPVGAANVSRYSAPFFIHAHEDEWLDQEKDIKAGPALMERLAIIHGGKQTVASM